MSYMKKMNEAVGMKDCLTMGGGGKWIVRPFRRQDIRKCIGCVLLEVTYGNKGHKLWSEIPKSFGDKAPNKLQIYVCSHTNLYKVCCDIYHPC